MKRKSGFVFGNEPRDVINNYEVNYVLNDLVLEFPKYKTYILSNIRRYIIKNMPCQIVEEKEAHDIYVDFYFSNYRVKQVKNPEAEKVKQKDGQFHRLLMSVALLSKIRMMLNYLIVNEITTKPSYDVHNLMIKSDRWLKRADYIKDIKEGETKFILESSDFKWVQLLDERAFIRESILMHNCVKKYYDQHLKGISQIYSLRDKTNRPIVTLEIRNGYFMQSKTVGNNSHKEYKDNVFELIDFLSIQNRIPKDEEFAVHESYAITHNNFCFNLESDQDTDIEEKESLLQKVKNSLNKLFK